jgi:hypothetical protein
VLIQPLYKETQMKRYLLIAAAAILLAAPAVMAETPAKPAATTAKAAKTYQVTGPVLEVTDTLIAVEKGKKNERWEIARTKDTKVAGELKVGERVTITYQMIAVGVEPKPAKK